MRAMSNAHKKAISQALMGRVVSVETKAKIGAANKGVWIKYNCDNCGKESEDKQFVRY